MVTLIIIHSYFQTGKSSWTVVNLTPITETSLTMPNLRESAEYEFSVTDAENKAGLGKPSNMSGAFVAKPPYSKSKFGSDWPVFSKADYI